LLGPADDPDAADSPRFQFLKGAAEAAGVDFFAPTPPAARPTPARFSHHILLVEDERTVLQFSTTVLVRGGYQVTPVEGCEAAWEAIQSGSYDLLVTDNRMPGMSGLELVSKLRFAQIALPIIVASGGIEAVDVTENPSLQPAIALLKPFIAEQLLETVAEALRRTGRHPRHTEVSFHACADSCHHRRINE
jgi:DNA-binding NtrC family response regulator